VRGSVKSDREGFYASALWLHARHPRTLALNAAPSLTLATSRTSPSCSTESCTAGCPPGPGQEGMPNHQVQPGPRLLRQPYASQPRGTGHARQLNEERVAASLEHDWGLAAATVVAYRTRRAEAAARAVEMYSKSVTTPPTGTVNSVTPIQSLSYANGTVQTPVS
jgi:hypothetical protein